MEAAALVAAACAACAVGCASEPRALTLVTLNIANGAGDIYRTDEARARQAALIDASGGQLAALEEVDVDVERSRHDDTARSVARLACVPETISVDGVRRCAGDGGAVWFALAFRADDPFATVDGTPFGIIDGDTTLDPTSVDRSHGAMYGNALVARGVALVEGYAVGLPTDEAQPTDDPLDALLARGDTVDGAARDALGTRNLALRTAPAIEPRVALVARVARAGEPPLSIVATHLESQGTNALRARQLARVIAVAAAERAGPPARDVALLGDFNLPRDATAPALEAAGFVHAAGASIDQIWLDAHLRLVDSAELPTDGASDHPTYARATLHPE